MAKLLVLFSSLLLSFGLAAKSLPAIDDMKNGLDKVGLVKKSTWEDEKKDGVFLKSMSAVPGVVAILNEDQMAIFMKIPAYDDKEKRVKSINQLFERCRKMADVVMKGVSDNHIELIDDIISSSAKVPGFTVSNLVKGFEFNSMINMLGDGVVVQCGVRNTKI
ncbi:hypothetical protein ACN4GA_08475 [Raoultella terrigena]|uniref:hypothetical protein n=1 Tax=Klebsiella variicola TaxID=244366 RepID=UPI000D74BD80|nr:hypothetical protein [Klebsiella variicola]PXM04781.1 hypothetical protein DMT34_09780 [Klebsiella variicola]